jgi:hypothetical protein
LSRESGEHTPRGRGGFHVIKNVIYVSYDIKRNYLGSGSSTGRFFNSRGIVHE